MARAIILVVDGFGIGAAPDAEQFGDTGANTFAHITQAYREHHDRPLALPQLAGMGLGASCQAVTSEILELLDAEPTGGAYGAAAEISSGKDTPSGHWEMTGVPVLFDWGYYPVQENCFPASFLDTLITQSNVPGVLGCCHASGTDIIKALGDEHRRSGKPICYTSADSVFQVAASEETFGLDNLYRFCEIARELLYDDNIGRVIARPFVGSSPEEYVRTGNRRDYSIEPPSDTLLDVLKAAGKRVSTIGKISDIFAHRGISESTKATGLENLINETIRQIRDDDAASVIFTNLVNFDQDFGHRRDPIGYAEALIYLDGRLAELKAAMKADDFLIITSDHGCDPTWVGTEHTREYVPLLVWQHDLPAISLGQRKTFADLAQSLADLFELPHFEHGESFLTADGQIR